MRTGKEAGESAKTGTIIRTAMKTNRSVQLDRWEIVTACPENKQRGIGVGWGGVGEEMVGGGEGRKKGEGEKTAGPKSGQEGGPPFSVTSHDR